MEMENLTPAMQRAVVVGRRGEVVVQQGASEMVCGDVNANVPAR